MSESTYSEDEIIEAAEQYIASIEKEVDEEQKKELREEIKDGKERCERLSQEHGEGHKLVEKAKKILNSRRTELEELEQLEKQVGTARDEFLAVIADDFELSEQWLKGNVLEAVTHALYGQRDSSYKLFAERITSLDDLTDYDELERIEMASVIALLAKDATGETEKVEEQYQRLIDSKSFAAFEVLCEHRNQTSQEAAEKLGEDSGTVNNWLKSPINFWDRMIPFYRPKKGEYDLSTTGLYFREHYYEGEIESGEDTDEDELKEKSEEGGEAGETQVTLGDTSVPSNESEGAAGDDGETEGSTNDNSETEGSASDDCGSEEVNISEIEDTQKKADAMFSKVSDEPEN